METVPKNTIKKNYTQIVGLSVGIKKQEHVTRIIKKITEYLTKKINVNNSIMVDI